MRSVQSGRQVLAGTLFAATALATGNAIHASTWDGGGTTDNFSDVTNWVEDATPVSPLTFDGSTRLTPLSDLNTSAVDWNVTFNAGAGAFTISGTGTTTGGVIRLGTGGLTNNSSNHQVSNIDFRLNGTRPVNAGAAGVTVRSMGSTSGTAGRTVTKNGTGTLIVNGFGGQSSGLMSYAINDGTVAFANTANGTLSGAISGVGNLSQTGAGTTTLTGTNTYTGTTSVSGGTLLINGTHTGAGNYTVAAGGTLGGTGAIGLAAVTNVITVNGTLVPGSATVIESLDVGAGDLTLAGTANFQIDLTAATFDEVNVGNLLTYGGTLNVAFTGSDADGATFDIFDFASPGGAFSAINFTGLDPQQTASFNPDNGIVTVTAVPEPAALSLLGLGAMALSARSRHRRRA